ncbi:hypothetical protein MXB_576 [Myxobolus squamalis]|nr:hypothetical protein MXB_576 [Myxobolus squamalis]
MQAKAAFPHVHLIVGVCNDALTHGRKGQTVMNENERYLSVLHCRYVDEVVKDAPWVITDEFLEEHRIDFVAHDDVSYPIGSSEDLYASIREKGMFIVTQRTPQVSTSELITRIVRNYDNYVRRNLFRGYSRSDLNLGFFSEKRIRIGAKISNFKRKINHLENYSDGLLRKWENKSHELVTDFIRLFIGNGPIVIFLWFIQALFLNGGKSMVKDILRINNYDEDANDDINFIHSE